MPASLGSSNPSDPHAVAVRPRRQHAARRARRRLGRCRSAGPPRPHRSRPPVHLQRPGDRQERWLPAAVRAPDRGRSLRDRLSGQAARARRHVRFGDRLARRHPPGRSRVARELAGRRRARREAARGGGARQGDRGACDVTRRQRTHPAHARGLRLRAARLGGNARRSAAALGRSRALSPGGGRGSRRDVRGRGARRSSAHAAGKFGEGAARGRRRRGQRVAGAAPACRPLRALRRRPDPPSRCSPCWPSTICRTIPRCSSSRTA